MKKYQVPEVSGVEADDESMKAHDEIVEWLHTMTQEWDGDESGINIYPPLGLNGEVSEPATAWVGDWVVEENGVFRVVKAADYNEFMKPYRFESSHTIATLEAKVDAKVFFEEGDLVKVEIKYEDELLILSPGMFFALLGRDAHEVYEKAAEAFQNKELAE